ncbi:28S ribosomal protein S18c, mitochondrial isoform X3 [Syngnathus typhle]|uniref:28S ribosomal protein S18c, mitochondrial isoform X3 n=1 Tax=Syngnathus typhle TaxID=161592 RepID=UPI002A6B2424|nr:28S ribosomal protein S18c, mitochondrial isoform X3 [Syngnathus typhle]
MLPLKRTYFLFGVFSRLRNASKAAACTGRPVSSDGQDQVKDHPFVRMNNPYKEPHKGCVLCDVTVDFKNIQLSVRFRTATRLGQKEHLTCTFRIVPKARMSAAFSVEV